MRYEVVNMPIGPQRSGSALIRLIKDLLLASWVQERKTRVPSTSTFSDPDASTKTPASTEPSYGHIEIVETRCNQKEKIIIRVNVDTDGISISCPHRYFSGEFWMCKKLVGKVPYPYCQYDKL